MSVDKKIIACNFRQGTSVARKGALAYLLSDNRGNGSDRVEILIRSRGGRWVEKWEDIRRLENFRVKTIPSEHFLYSYSRAGYGFWLPESGIDFNKVAEGYRNK